MAQGAMVGAITQGAIGAASGAASGAIIHRMTTGSWSGAANAAIDGAATGFLTGTITGAVSGALSSPYCFVAGTTVLVAGGLAAIETIQKGDYVWAWDEETGTVGLKKVVETYVNETDELVHVHVNGEEIITTPSHPFYSPVKGWTNAIHLRAGDILVLVNGEYVVVEKVQHEILEAPVVVYNFQVEDYHTYYVSDNSVLVHNKCINDHATSQTKNQSINFDTERQARNFARTKVGHNPLDNGSGKMVSRNLKWQYRAKMNDILNGHIHLERLDPRTGKVLINYHLRW